MASRFFRDPRYKSNQTSEKWAETCRSLMANCANYEAWMREFSQYLQACWQAGRVPRLKVTPPVYWGGPIGSRKSRRIAA